MVTIKEIITKAAGASIRENGGSFIKISGAVAKRLSRNTR